MNRTDQIKFCKVCMNGDFDFSRGIICRKTNDKADFNDECPDFRLKANELYPVFQEEMTEVTEQRPLFPWVKFTANDRWLLASVIGGMTFFLRMITYSELLTYWIRNLFWLFVLFNGNTIGLILKKRTDYTYTFFGDLKFRIYVATGISLLNSLYILLIENRNWYQTIGIALLLFSMSLMMSFLSNMAAIPISGFIHRKSMIYEDKDI